MRIESEEIYDDEGLYCWIVRDVAYSIYEVEKTTAWVKVKCAMIWLELESVNGIGVRISGWNVIPESDRNWVFFCNCIYLYFVRI